jgi:transposase
MTTGPFKSGEHRGQAALLPARIEDYVGADNPVRAIEAYVCSLDLAGLSFVHAGRGVSAGQPPYDPADLLKLYLYGYLNQVRSSRRLEREAGRNLEVMWLLRGLVPSYRTIADFRKANPVSLSAANRGFVRLVHDLKLVSGELVAIDGAFFDGNASKGSMVTGKRLAERLALLERDIAAYGAVLEANDAAEDAARGAAVPAQDDGSDGPGGEAKLAALLAKRAQVRVQVAQLAASGETQLSRTDADARLLSKRGQAVAGYNVQIAVDAQHKLIVASEVVNAGNDTGQLHALALAAKQAVGCETLKVVADVGYYNGETLRACEADGIEAHVPTPEHTARFAAQERFTREAFDYDAEADVYRCPAGQALQPMEGRTLDGSGKFLIRYASRRTECRACLLRAQCLTAKGDRREIYRWECEAVIERHRARMATPEAGAIVAQRKTLVEHPFGTLKCRAGYRHFLVRGFAKVRGEWGLMALCYNFTRLLSIFGLHSFIAKLAELVRMAAWGLLNTLLALIQASSAPLQLETTPLSAKLPHQRQFAPANT